MTLTLPVWAGGFRGEFRGDKVFSDTTERWSAVAGGDAVIAFDRLVYRKSADDRGRLLYPEDTQWYLFLKALSALARVLPDEAETMAQDSRERIKLGQGPPFLFLIIKLKGEFPAGQPVSGELDAFGKRIASQVWSGLDPDRSEWETTTRPGEREQYRILVFDVHSLSPARPHEVLDSCSLAVSIGAQRFELKDLSQDDASAP